MSVSISAIIPSTNKTIAIIRDMNIDFLSLYFLINTSGGNGSAKYKIPKNKSAKLTMNAPAVGSREYIKIPMPIDSTSIPLSIENGVLYFSFKS